MSATKTTQYGVYVVMFLPNKIIIKNKKNNYHKNMLALHIVLKPCSKSCARPPKQVMVLLYMV